MGARFVIDGTQSVGALPFDVGHTRPDAVACAGYKWLTGPYSVGTAWYGPAFDGGTPIEENWITRAGSDRFNELVNYRDDYRPGAIRYDVSERSNFILLPMFEVVAERNGSAPLGPRTCFQGFRCWGSCGGSRRRSVLGWRNHSVTAHRMFADARAARPSTHARNVSAIPSNEPP